MVVPDFELICEIMLVAEGFLEARLLANFIFMFSISIIIIIDLIFVDFGFFSLCLEICKDI
jgi:hypothetical protein